MAIARARCALARDRRRGAFADRVRRRQRRPVRRLEPDLVVLVADAGLGTINSVRLSAAALAPWPLVVFLNRYDESDELHALNRAWLADRDGFEVVTTPGALTKRLIR